MTKNRTESKSEPNGSKHHSKKQRYNKSITKWQKYTTKFCNSHSFKCDGGNGAIFKALIRSSKPT